MSSESQELPFQTLGEQLKGWRKKLRETVADVSGAVEIDEDVLRRIERGTERPSEDILNLLIAHFNMKEDEADRLWELAGYEFDTDHDHEHEHDPRESLEDHLAHISKNHPLVMVMALDPRVMYSDGLEISGNKRGLVMNFTQSSSPTQSMSIARIGMSYEHAKNVLDILAKTLKQAESMQQPKQLPAPKKPQDQENSENQK